MIGFFLVLGIVMSFVSVFCSALFVFRLIDRIDNCEKVLHLIDLWQDDVDALKEYLENWQITRRPGQDAVVNPAPGDCYQGSRTTLREEVGRRELGLRLRRGAKANMESQGAKEKS